MAGESEPKSEKFHLEINGKTFECTNIDTLAVIQTEEYKDYDYILHRTSAGEPIIVFRETIANDFDNVIELMLHNDFVVYSQEEPTELDKQAYLSTFGRDPAHKTILSERELTPRQKKKVEFLRYLLNSDGLTPIDFNGEGDLYL